MVDYIAQRDREKAEAKAAAAAGSGEESPAERPKLRNRSRGMSLEKVLTAFKSQKHRRTISKEDISKPILSDDSPIELPSPLTPLGQVSASPSPTVSQPHTPPEPTGSSPVVAIQSPRTPPVVPSLRTYASAPARIADEPSFPPSESNELLRWLFENSHLHAHAYPVPKRTTPSLSTAPDTRQARISRRRRARTEQTLPNSTPRLSIAQGKIANRGNSPLIAVPPLPNRTPLPPPLIVRTQVGRFDSGYDDTFEETQPGLRPPVVFTDRNLQEQQYSPKRLSKISEASRESDDHPARKCTQRLVARMEPVRLQPPSVGTKSRAIQQAKEMEQLVAERAKRSGDEPPPHDFFELIGKGAYGRVFKGYVLRK